MECNLFIFKNYALASFHLCLIVNYMILNDKHNYNCDYVVRFNYEKIE